MRIRTDLSALRRDGLLQAYRVLVEPDGVTVNIGDRLLVLDMMGGEEAYIGVVHGIDGEQLLLDVDWDNDHASVIEPTSQSTGLSFGSFAWGTIEDNESSEPVTPPVSVSI